MDMNDLTIKRLDFDLNEDSIVLNVGGYTGDWASSLYNKYHCNLYIYEPVQEFCEVLEAKFKDDPKVRIFNYGVLDKTVDLPIKVSGDGSSLYTPGGERVVHFKDISEVLDQFVKVDLMEINTEGAEYDTIKRLGETKKTGQVNSYLVQFHSFIKDSSSKLSDCRNILSQTHRSIWNIDFVFECWKIK